MKLLYMVDDNPHGTNSGNFLALLNLLADSEMLFLENTSSLLHKMPSIGHLLFKMILLCSRRKDTRIKFGGGTGG